MFLHGSGDTGPNLLMALRYTKFEAALNQAGIKLICPSAKPIPYSMFGGEVASVWHDRNGLGPKYKEDGKGIESSLVALEQDLKALGLPRSKIIVGGFSQGGHMALHVAYRNQPKPKPKQLKSDDDKKNNPTPRQEKGTPRQEKGTFAGCFVMSSYLHDDSLLYKNSEDQEVRSYRASVPLFMTHGKVDSLIPAGWGEATASKLGNLGYKASFKSFSRDDHEIGDEALEEVLKFIFARFST